MNEDFTEVVTTDESGVISLVNVTEGKILRKFKDENVDRVFNVDFRNDIILGGGQDRRISVYNRYTDDSYFIHSDFLVYCVGLSTNGEYGAYSANEDNEIFVFNTLTKDRLATFSGHVANPTKIVFLSDSKLISSGEDGLVLFWSVD